MVKRSLLCQICAEITSTLEKDKVLPLVVDRAKVLTQAEKVVAFSIDKGKALSNFSLDSESLIVRGRRDQHPELWWKSKLEEIIKRHGEVHHSHRSEEKNKATEAVTRKSKESSLFCFPFPPSKNNLGLLAALNSPSRQFTAKEIATFSILASQAAVALENAEIVKELQIWDNEVKLLREMEDLSQRLLDIQEEECRRISRDLHDDTAQLLTNAIIRLEMSKNSIPPELKEIRDLLEELKKSTTLALDGIHRIAFDLRPTMLDDLGLIPTIKWYIRSRIEDRNLKVAFEVSGRKKRLPPKIEIAALRITQEALLNVKKHAQASQASLFLGFKQNEMTVTIRDNGRGFNYEKAFAETAKREALGLRSMKERAKLLGGVFNIKSERDKGTEVLVLFPFKRKERLVDEKDKSFIS